jgi:alkanesulfonate monooxygenase SsuD/methylene tetrahydromethanopterin reductase-like flavin-dependent oxidoreductase (luciferase family)
VSLGRDRAEAEARLRRSQHFRRLTAVQGDEQHVLDAFVERNLFGSPDQIRDQLAAFQAAGADHLGLIFLGDTIDDLLGDLDRFAEHVLPAFPA